MTRTSVSLPAAVLVLLGSFALQASSSGEEQSQPGQTPVADVFLKAAALGPIAPQKAAARAVAVQDNDPHATGLVPPTPEQLRWEKDNMIVARNVKPNALGLARLNAEAGGASKRAIVLPAAVDNSQLNCFPPIRSQGGIGSCACFSSVYYTMTHMVGLARGWNTKNSSHDDKFSPKWCYNMINGGSDSGSWFSGAYAIMINHGVGTWAQFPYDSNYRQWCLDASVWRDAIQYRMHQTGSVYNLDTDTGLHDLKQMLANGYVLNFATYVSSWRYMSGGIDDDPATTDDDAFVGQQVCYYVNGTSGGHGMTVVGYNDDLWVDINGNGTVDPGEKGALKVANSWGAGWRNSGYIWFAYDGLKATTAVSGWTPSGKREGWWSRRAYWITPRTSYTPRLLAEFTISHPKRARLRMSLGTADGAATSPTTNWYPSAIYYDGGDYAFNGTTTECDGSFVFDFTDIAPGPGVAKRFFLGMYCNTADTGTIKAYKLIDVVNGDAETVATGLPSTVSSGQLWSWVDYTQNSTNTAPTVSAIADQHLAVNAESAVLPFTIGDAQTPVGDLALTASSSSSVILAPNIILGGSGANRTVKLIPQVDRTGTVTITINVSDPETTTSTDFTVTVSHAPTITEIGDQTIDEDDTTGAIAFTIDDLDSAVGSLAVSATSSNTTLVPASNVAVAGGGANRTVAVTPAANQHGSTTITVSVSDEHHTTQEQFVVTVTPVEDAPNVGSAPTATPNPAAVGKAVAFGIAASDADGDALSYTWNFGDGTSSNAASPDHIFSAAGTYHVSVSVSDGKSPAATAGIDVTVRDPAIDKDLDGIVDAEDPDDDNDGFSDADEEQAGTNPHDNTSKPGGSADCDQDGVPDDQDRDSDGDGVWDEFEREDGTDPFDQDSALIAELQVDKLRLKALFAAAGKDSVMMKGVIPNLPAGFSPDGVVLELDFGGVIVSFTLDAKGRAKAANGMAKMKLKCKKNPETRQKEFIGGPVPLMVKLKGGTWAGLWEAQGFDPDVDAKNQTMAFGVGMTLYGRRYQATANGAYTCKAQKCGTFKK